VYSRSVTNLRKQTRT